MSIAFGSAKISDSLVGLSTESRATDNDSHGSAFAASPISDMAITHDLADHCGTTTPTTPNSSSTAPMITGMTACRRPRANDRAQQPPDNTSPVPMPIAGNP